MHVKKVHIVLFVFTTDFPEKSLQRSRHADLKRLVTENSYDVDEAVKLVVKIKQIVEDVHIE